MCGEGRGAQLELPNKSNPEKAGVSFVIGDPNDWEVAGGGGRGAVAGVHSALRDQ